MERSMNPVLQFHKKMKMQKQQRRKEAHEKQKKFERMKQEKLLQKQQKQQDQKEDEEDGEKEQIQQEIIPQEPVINLDQIKDEKIRVPGYSQEFSKKSIEMNKAFLDPQKRKYLPTNESKTSSNTINDKVLEYQAKPNEKIYKNSDGVIITDEVLKIFGGKIDPSKIKIGYKQRQAPAQTTYYDPFSKVTEEMNFDYIKNLEKQKQLPVEEQPKPIEVVAPPPQKIFKKDDEEDDEPKPKKNICPDVIIKESTVKKSKIDLTKNNTPMIPLSLQRKQQAQQNQQNLTEKKDEIKIGPQMGPSTKSNIQSDKQNDFRKIVQESQIKKKPEEAFSDFLRDIQFL